MEKFILDVLSDDDLLAVLSAMDHTSVCRAQSTCVRLKQAGRSQYVWKSLYSGCVRHETVLQPPTDWLGAFKRINPAWDDPVLDAASSYAWRSLPGAPSGVGGQDPKLLDVGGTCLWE